MFCVILARPENPENMGLAARAMANTGFKDLRLTGLRKLSAKAYRTSVHADEILDKAKLFPGLEAAVADLHVVFAATARWRTNFPSMPLEGAVKKMRSYPTSTRIGLLFGNERTGLTSEEMRHSNFRFTIPQAARQPSYNLASAVLLTLFPLLAASRPAGPVPFEKPVARRAQADCLTRIAGILEERAFMHEANRAYVTDQIFDLFGRLAMTEKDRRLLLALFYKGAKEPNAAMARRSRSDRLEFSRGGFRDGR